MNDKQPEYPESGSAIPEQPGYVVGTCGHRVAGSEWRAGFQTCERCPSDADADDVGVTEDPRTAPDAYLIQADPETVRWLTAAEGIDRLGGDTDTRYGLTDLGGGQVRIPAASIPLLQNRNGDEDGIVCCIDGNYEMWIGGLYYPLTPVTEVQDSMVIHIDPSPGDVEHMYAQVAKWARVTTGEAGEMLSAVQETIAARTEAVRAARHQAELEEATPEGLKVYRVIVGPSGEVFQPACGWVVDVNVDTEKELRHDLEDADHMGALLERKYAARWLSKELKDAPAGDAGERADVTSTFNPAAREGQAICRLLRRIKDDVEQEDGGWPGADLVDVVTERFTGLGFDVDKSATDQRAAPPARQEVVTSAEAWADALDAEMQRTGRSAGDLVSHAYAAGQVCGVVLDPDHPEADDARGVLVSAALGWVVRYVAQNRWWIAD